MKNIILLVVVFVLLGCGNDKPVEKKTKIHLYEVILSNGDTTYINAHSYKWEDDFSSTCYFYEDDLELRSFSAVKDPISVKKIK